MRQFHWIKNCLNEIKVYFSYIQNCSFKKILIIKGCMGNIYWQVRISRKYLEAYRTVKKFDSPFFAYFVFKKSRFQSVSLIISISEYEHAFIFSVKMCSYLTFSVRYYKQDWKRSASKARKTFLMYQRSALKYFIALLSTKNELN